jgi:ComF family protein
MVNRILARWTSWLWPGRCLLCRARTRSDSGWCDGCYADLPWLRHACPICAAPLALDSRAPCGACQRKAPAFDRTIAALHYASPADRLIVSLKFHQRLELARALGWVLAQRIRLAAVSMPQVVIPVPLHRSRLRERGYNQSLEVARIVAKQLSLTVSARAAKRVRATASQMTLPRHERARNVRNAFVVHYKHVADRHVAIVDDVMTSGHTINALAKALRRAGARNISVWIIARA